MTPDELRAEFAGLPETGTGPPYSWQRHRQSFRRHAREDDPLKFLRWSTVVATMFVGNAPHILYELNYISPEYWWDTIEEPWFGDAIPFTFAPYTSGNLIHQAFHLKVFEDLSGKRISEMGSIYEFGGGYGAMALMARRFGFGGRYVIQDLPELSILQRFYLSNIGIEADCITELPIERNYDMFIGCFSVSEVEVWERNDVLNHVNASSYLFAFQHVWEEVDNSEWFRDFVERKGMDNELRLMDHMETGPNFHLVMWR